jgi:hypothetical protein
MSSVKLCCWLLCVVCLVAVPLIHKGTPIFQTFQPDMPINHLLTGVTLSLPNDGTVTMKRAYGDTPETMMGEGIDARLTSMTIAADKGRRVDNKIILQGHVHLTHDKGYDLHTSTATLDLNKNQVSGDKPITGIGPDQRIEAGSFYTDAGAKNIYFKGGAKIVFTDTSS